MLIGITGDTHNNLKNISKICNIFNSQKVDLVIHTGDITLPKSLSSFSALKMPLIGVFGNNDIPEKDSLLKVSDNFNFRLYEEPHLINIEKTKVMILHHPELIDQEMLNNSDIIVYGHTHRYKKEILNNTLVFNPGECAGFLEGKNKVGIIEVHTKKAKIISF